ncbi:MAG: SCO family protein [Leptothrix sp. (in: b-proteobacteria)]
MKSESKPRGRRALLLGAAAAVSLTLAAGLSGCDKPKPAVAFKSVDLTGADYANAFDLPDVDGQRRNLAQFKGKLVVVFFGYTQCPDVCPTTLSDLVQVQKLLGADADKLVAVLVTVDPERDSAELLKAYIGSFNPNWVALRGNEDEISATAKAFKVFYRKAAGNTPETYTVDHTAASYVFDTEGRIRLYVRNGSPVADTAADLKALLAEKA